MGGAAARCGRAAEGRREWRCRGARYAAGRAAEGGVGTGGGGGEGLGDGGGGGDDDEEEGEAEVVENGVGDTDSGEAKGGLGDTADVGHVDDGGDGVQHHRRVGGQRYRPNLSIVGCVEDGQPSCSSYGFGFLSMSWLFACRFRSMAWLFISRVRRSHTG